MKKINAKKIIDIVVDIVLFAIVFYVKDNLMVNVIKSENLWLELSVYLVLYAIAFGTKQGVVFLWKKVASKKKKENKKSV